MFSGQLTTPDRFSYHTGPALRSYYALRCLPTLILNDTRLNSISETRSDPLKTGPGDCGSGTAPLASGQPL